MKHFVTSAWCVGVAMFYLLHGERELFMPNWLPANSGATVTTVTLTDVEITLKIMFVY